MQICIIIVLSNPSSQSQVKLPLVFWQVPFPQTPLMMLHSSISKRKIEGVSGNHPQARIGQ